MKKDNKVFSLEDQQNSVDLLYYDDDIMIASIDLFHVDGEDECNRNNCNISMETAKKSLKTIYNKPIICRYNSISKDFVTDVTEHAHNDKEKFEMQIAGHIPSDSRITFIERDNGKIYCNAEAVIQKRYMPQLVDILNNNDGKIKVSIEIKAKGNTDEETGIFNIAEFILQGVCLLGKDVMEGIEGSHLEVLKFSKQDIYSMNEKYIKFSKSKENNRNIFDEIKSKLQKEDKDIMNSLGMRDLQEQLWKTLQSHKYHDGELEFDKYYIEEIYPDEKNIIIRDNETALYYKVPYMVQDNEVIVDIGGKVEVEKTWYERPLDDKRFSLIFAKEDYGTGETIKVDKSKDAVSNKAWGDVDKTALRHKVLSAKNYKSLVHDVYAEVEDGWEDAPSEKLKYPIMLIEGDTAVYARYGLASALGYAKAENNTSVVNKVEKLYKTIEIDEKEGTMDNEKDIENKLDKDNPEVDKIKDDADAIEDDKKEELDNACDTKVESEMEEENNSADVKDEENLENAVIDAPEQDKLADDIDADKDYWKKKHDEVVSEFEAFKTNFAAMEEELKGYKAKEDKDLMNKYLKSFKNCMSKDDYVVMASKIDNAVRVDFEKEVDDKVKDFAKKMFGCVDVDDDDDDNIEIKNSCGNIVNPYMNKKTEHSKRTIDDVLDSLK